MPRPLALLVLLIVVLSRTAWGDYQAGLRAWGSGDYAAAAAAFLPAAEAGEAESQYMLGRLYALGDGVPRDFVQSWLWFDRAARRGHAQAAEARASLEGVLNPQQLALARQLATPPAPPPAPIQVPAQTAQHSLREAPRMVAGQAERPVVLVPRRGTVAVTPFAADQQQAAR